MKKSLLALICIVFLLKLQAQQAGNIKMSGYIGVNSNVAAYDQRYLTDLSRCTKWIREYHSWAHYEAANDYYKWDSITTHPQGYTWPDHTRFMNECRKLGIQVLISVLNKPSWAGSDRGAYHTGDGSRPQDYLERLEFIGQLVARYGAQKVDKSLLETADKYTGLNYIRYFEDENEPDYWWENPRWPAEKYAVYCNAVHDGYGVETSSDYPLLGIKSVDSTAVHVLAGMASETPAYIKKVLENSNGRVPFDVINIHTYCTDQKNGYSPENENYGLEKKLGSFMQWCRSTLPGMPVWLTEFGWDTYIDKGVHSYVYAPPLQQANYILRSYLVSLHMGFEKAFLFMDKDPNSTHTLQYSSSGLLKDKNAGLQKKPSYYFLATLQHVLGNAFYDTTLVYGEPAGNNEIYGFRFHGETDEDIYVFWTRGTNTATDNGASAPYRLHLDYQPKDAYSILPRDKDMDGDTLVHEIKGNYIDLVLSETPQFIVVPQNRTSAVFTGSNNMEVRIYPNPAGERLNISLLNSDSRKIKVSVHSSDGRLLQVLADQVFEAGTNCLSFGKNYNAGTYLVNITSGNFRKSEKVLITK
jgi:hypothetical protein